MAYFFTLEQLGRETFEIESLLSYWCRLSALHGLTINQLGSAIAAWGQRHGLAFPNNLLYGRSLSMCGYGDDVQKLVRILEVAVGTSGLAAGTLLGLRAVLAPGGRGALKKFKAWCPSCYQDDVKLHGECFDRLFWGLEAIERCPIHKLKLWSNCPHCNSAQRYPHTGGFISRCRSCDESLIGEPRVQDVMLHPGFAEADLSNLLGFLAGSDPHMVQNDAFRIYEFYASQIRRSKLIAANGVVDSEKASIPIPTLKTLLKIVVQDGADLVQVLVSPKEAAGQSQQLANYTLSFDVVRSMCTPEQILERTRKMLAEASAGNGKESFRYHCRQIGVRKEFAQSKFPELYEKMIRQQNAYGTRSRGRRIRGSIRLQIDSEWDRYPEGTHASQENLLAAVSSIYGGSTRAARLMIFRRIHGKRWNRFAVDKAVLLERHVHWLLSTSDYIKTFGGSVVSLCTKLSALQCEGRLFTVRKSGKRLPSFQLDSRGIPLPIFRPLLDHIRPSVEVEFFLWFLTPNKALSNKRPVDVLDGSADEALLALVEAEFGGVPADLDESPRISS